MCFGHCISNVIFYLIEPYQAKNASHLISDKFRDPDGNWYGIYKGILGFFYNKEDLERKGLGAPKDWPDLIDGKYIGVVITPILFGNLGIFFFFSLSNNPSLQ